VAGEVAPRPQSGARTVFKQTSMWWRGARSCDTIQRPIRPRWEGALARAPTVATKTEVTRRDGGGKGQRERMERRGVLGHEALHTSLLASSTCGTNEDVKSDAVPHPVPPCKPRETPVVVTITTLAVKWMTSSAIAASPSVHTTSPTRGVGNKNLSLLPWLG